MNEQFNWHKNQLEHKGLQHLHVSKQATKISEIRLHYLGYKQLFDTVQPLLISCTYLLLCQLCIMNTLVVVHSMLSKIHCVQRSTLGSLF